MIPMLLFTLPAGHVADNFNRKRVVMWMTTVLAVASIGVAVILRHAPVWWFLSACSLAAPPARSCGGQRRFFAALVDRKLFPAR